MEAQIQLEKRGLVWLPQEMAWNLLMMVQSMDKKTNCLEAGTLMYT